MYNCKENLEFIIGKSDVAFSGGERGSLEALKIHKEKFIRSMDDDLNTADAIAAIFELIADVNKKIREGASADYAKGALDLLTELANVLGLLEERDVSGAANEGEDAEINALIEERGTARAEKNWVRADEIRDILKEKGITLKDTPQGVQIIRESNSL